MVTHIVIFTFTPGTTPGQVNAFGAAMSRMASEVPEVLAISHGRNLALREGNGDYALVATFRDPAAWSAYQAHPLHKAFVRDFVTPIVAGRLAIQF
ncbi:MAG: Dabb family protein [Steroidobacteraceae bacterium]|nr:Dabb family protein [Nevskiaceae bacterium]MCP5472510.1 Dabb family protein [Nevskiaceae bacterium]